MRNRSHDAEVLPAYLESSRSPELNRLSELVWKIYHGNVLGY